MIKFVPFKTFLLENHVVDASHWEKIGPQKGTNPGGIYKDKNGTHYYVKHQHSTDHAKNEVLAGHLYHAASAPVIQSHLIRLPNNKIGTASKLQHIEKNINPNSNTDKYEAAKHFATHVWTANWDAAGLEHDNQAKINGKMHTIDVGGALKYRAQGGEKGKHFGHEANEWHSLRNPNINKQNSQLFGHMNHEQLKSSAKNVTDISDHTIHHLVHTHGPGDHKEKEELVKKLIARKNHISKLAGI